MRRYRKLVVRAGKLCGRILIGHHEFHDDAANRDVSDVLPALDRRRLVSPGRLVLPGALIPRRKASAGASCGGTHAEGPGSVTLLTSRQEST